ncbi:RCC1 domain-containing protein [Streptomyces sp. Root1310]|uniref:RCC1-like domain-containing protein n=1 Tax=Streptomyces sp. Root1310 TaxID=1736452 RepID=UPI00099F32B3|nr:RCC1 domain-containing protein [Streptomyces sp. Root1310]
MAGSPRSTATTVLAWGAGRAGQLGDGTTADRLSPGAVTGLVRAEVVKIVSGGRHGPGSCRRTVGERVGPRFPRCGRGLGAVPVLDEWRLAADVGRRYGAASGDRNTSDDGVPPHRILSPGTDVGGRRWNSRGYASAAMMCGWNWLALVGTVGRSPQTGAPA